ncbi:uncharacterized protein LOC126747195 [Anthonomus grandis grandis]|uniref:uncharacterized protein LOC126747195 n=1 Tax=Anthonomus grandis grandis TaxID=2921223 RepID=UPI0021666400|nr:uncharacterized protein LOC126747195 [Anthonomus grandis grandis]
MRFLQKVLSKKGCFNLSLNPAGKLLPSSPELQSQEGDWTKSSIEGSDININEQSILQSFQPRQETARISSTGQEEVTHQNSAPHVEKPFPGGREVIREALSRQDIPESSINICLSSISLSTLKQYTSGLKLWWEFCSNRNVNPYEVSVERVLEFLTLFFEKGSSYGTLNTYRAALGQIAGPVLGNDFRLKRFFKGVFGVRQPLPKYENIWDPGIVLNFIRSLDKNEILSLEVITKKLATLLALATGHRLQTLSLIEIANICVKDDKIEIPIPGKIKTSRFNKSQLFLVLPFFNSEPIVCVARCLRTYLVITDTLRSGCKYLFISIKKPHHRATTQTIGKWIKCFLKKSGVDVNRFKPQSTRHAATSAAARQGVNFDTIRRAAGWSENSKTFANFYNRPLVNNNKDFANAILSLN